MSQLIPKSTLLIVDNFCGRCGTDLLAQDNFCRSCGAVTHGGELIEQDGSNSSKSAVATRGQELSSPAGAIQTVLNNRWYVGMVIALIGPFGLPALWFSPRFSKPTKIIGTLFFVVMTTVVPLAVALYFLEYRLRPLVDALGG